MKRGNKKGAVNIITTVLIILIVIVGVTIIFNVVKPLVTERSGGIETGFKNYLAALQDSDGDGYTNEEERTAGTDPYDPDDFPGAHGLIAYYGFDGNADDLIGAHNGTPYNVNFIEVNGRNVAEFDGLTSYINVSDFGDDWLPTGDMAISTWVYAKSWGGGNTARIVASHDAQRFYLDGNVNTRLRYSSNDGGTKATSAEDMVLGEWKHLVMNRIGTDIYFYIDGVESDGADPNGGSPISGDYVVLGSDPSQESVFDGYIDNILIYDRPLTVLEIAELYEPTIVEPPIEYIEIDSCQELNELNGAYLLQNDINNYAGTCFSITADNIILNGNEYTIEGDGSAVDYGIYTDGNDNLTIMNLTVTNFYHGIRLDSSLKNTLTNINASSNIYTGILLSESSNNILTNITTNSNGGDGISLSYSNYTTLTNITTNSNGHQGIYISSGSNNIFTDFSVWNSSTAGSYYAAILLNGGSNNTFENGFVNFSGAFGIVLGSEFMSGGSSNNVFRDMWIDNTHKSNVILSATKEGIAINNTFLDVVYSDVESMFGVTELIRKWSYSAQVKGYCHSPIPGATIKIYNSGNLIAEETTGIDGKIGIDLTEYVNEEGSRNYFGDYTIEAEMNGETVSHEYRPNASQVNLDSFVMAGWPVDVGEGACGSNLPIVIVDVFGQTISGTNKIVGSMKIIENPNGERNYITDVPNDYDGMVGIKRRGQSSDWPEVLKKQYGIETWAYTGSGNILDVNNYVDNQVSIMGFPTEEDWILNGPYIDRTLLRNYITFDLTNQMGRYASRTKWAEVYFNDSGVLDYKGLYLLFEKIKRDPNRVDVSKLEPNEISGEDLTGGYIIKLDKIDPGEEFFVTGNQAYIQYIYVYPDAGDMAQEQKDYIQTYVSDFEATLLGPDFTDPVDGYAKYIDVDSFIDYLAMVEFSKNMDGLRISTFMYKDKNGKLFMGPVWDYNYAYGNGWVNSYLSSGPEANGWQFEMPESRWWPIPFWWSRLMEDPVFSQKFKDRWFELRQNEFNLETNVFPEIDNALDLINEAGKRNYDKWPEVLVGSPNPIRLSYCDYSVNFEPCPGSWEGEIDYMKDWLTQRVNWIDANINSL